MADPAWEEILKFRKSLRKRLDVDKALEPGDELYEPIYEDDERDPVYLIMEDITLSEVESLNFITRSGERVGDAATCLASIDPGGTGTFLWQIQEKRIA
ncbi:MAG: hypothetical protein CMO80_12575 [Verrucomicrobiales bacterium]|nr:hypothetical protein [Verrucomicrobiales bacterium]|tara:strand:- start:12160 stop:12456 length:297 start_codon:yes stop_codon:yes gene_type:complete